MRHLHTKRTAFTMIELVFAIVVIGILASLAMPRIDRDLVTEAATNILADIRYTQHLALMDNMHEWNDPMWQQKFWRIVFSDCNDNNYFYMIGSDTSKDSSNSANFAQAEAALDPTNNLPLFYNCVTATKPNVSQRIFITDKYGITNIVANNECSNNNTNRHIGFDYLGRPHWNFSASTQPNSASYMNNDCTFTFTMSTDANNDDKNDTFQIQINAETGYAFIVGQPDS